MSEFKKQVFIQFYPNLWLNNPKLRMLKPEVKGFYIDLMCQLHYCFPYGYCSVLNTLKANKLQKWVNPPLKGMVNPRDKDEDNLWLNLTLYCSVAKQLTVVDNIEGDLHKCLPYSQDEIVGWIRVLEESGIISRTPKGIIYVRKMVKDFKRRLDAHLNGVKGGSPKLKNSKKNKKNLQNDVDKSLEDNQLQNPLKGVGYPSSNYNLSNVFNKVGREIVKRENESTNPEDNEKIIPRGTFQMQILYEKQWKDIADGTQASIPGLTEEGFKIWKEFVDFIEAKGFTDIWTCKPLGPKDFQTLYFSKGFRRDLWEDVINHILGSGIQPHYSLFYRIPQFIGYRESDRKIKGSQAPSESVSKIDHTKQQGW